MARTEPSEWHLGPRDEPPVFERVLRWTWMTAVGLALLVGVFVVPIQFIDGREAALAEQIESSGAAPYPVLELRQHVDRARGSYTVDELVATYRADSGTQTVSLRGYDQSAVVTEEEGWFDVPPSDGTREVHVAADGSTGFLAEDYRSILDGEFDGLYRVADTWIGGWAVVGLAAVTWLWLRRARRGVTTNRRAALVPALYCGTAAVLVLLLWGLSFPLAA